MNGTVVRPVLASEWIKARSTLATMISLSVGVVVSVGLALASGFSIRAAFDRSSDALRPDFHPIDAGFGGLIYGNLAFTVFAVLVVSSEYTSGTIRASLAAVPRRGLFYLCKLGVTGLVCVVVGGVTTLGAFLVTQVALGPYGVELSDPGAVQAVLGGLAYVTLLGVFAAAVAAVLRGTALTLGILIPFFFVVSPALWLIPATRSAARFLPDQAGMRAMEATVGPGELTQNQGLLVLLGWTVLAVAAGYWSIRRRDA
ncbi:ABC transporter permease subunit [Micromonospora sp. NBC_01699]|uniref:ABC transporter permease subunit n=1 Tax=Micromonospora sp. NBC_01699 TaxID=2975984 RepID=UPI002E3269E4|nr:ABC transporter permease subunit [Micromonospora sp. NBC_01699]